MHKGVELKYMQKFGDMGCQVQSLFSVSVIGALALFFDTSQPYMW